MMREWWRRASKDRRRRAVELAATLVLIGAVSWQYGALAPQVIIVLSFWLSLIVALVQLPFLAGYFGSGRLRPVLIAALVALPFVIARAYDALYGKDLLLLWYDEWLGGVRPFQAALVIAALPVLSFLAGLFSRRMRKHRPMAVQGGNMPNLIPGPTVIAAAGNKPKTIEEYVGRVNSGTADVSIARMQSPPGWREPGQTPAFDEYTVVLKGMLQVETKEGVIEVRAGQAVIARRGEWVRYGSPGPEGAEYIAVCLPAFSPETVNREV